MADANSGIPGGTPASASNVPQLGDTPLAAPEKLIGGKYKTIDEAIIASDRGYHEVNEKLSKIVGVLEAAMAPQPQYQQQYQQVPVGQPGNQQFDPYSRGQSETIDPTAFITNPGKFLRERDEKLTGDIIQKVSGVVQEVVSNAMAVGDFKARHPEMIQHEPLVRTFMDRTDPRKPISQRLEEAATETAKYLQKVGANSNRGNQPPIGDAVVEGATQSTVAPAPLATPLPSADGSEADLAAYIRERNADYGAKFGIAKV